MRYYVDTNILARLYEGVGETKSLVNFLRQGVDEVLIPAVVVEEMVWLMSRFYKSSKKEIIEFQRSVTTLGEIVYEYNMEDALNLFEKVKAKFNDCVIWSVMGGDGVVVSYDKEFDKLPGIKRVEPRDLIN
ncbi:MAG: PIN domain-containing protein [Candidatus Shapirobacteria bacterium]|jgi:predicted nucleic acid-binding protein